jgi:L-seryl-tRNA(Ser) seleniumtransferase
VQEALADGIGLVTFSGDKLLGGPQCGIVAGRANLVARLRSNPLLRALRVDKMTVAALGATLQLYRDDVVERIPIFRMFSATLQELRDRARTYCDAIPQGTVVDSDAYVGGGALPRERIASVAVAVATDQPDRFAAALREADRPIVARIDEGSVLLDLRTIPPQEDTTVIAALAATQGRLS